ncbi:MAG TPA: hypothetical protein VFA65_24370 [Bryobacteraceae bacterium]|nr:hypothetical protein [Bryobacteraceae bacterium]
MCFSLGWLEQLLVWLVIVVAIIMILKLVVPWVAAQLGIPIIAQVLSIILWAVVLIFVIYFVFALLSCLGGGGLPLFPHNHWS